MGSRLVRAPVDSPLCTEIYIDEPGDVAELVHHSTRVLAPDVLPWAVQMIDSHLVSPPSKPVRHRPFEVSPMTVFLGPTHEMDMWMDGKKRTVQWQPGSLSILPPTCDVRIAWRGEVRGTVFSCPPEYLEQLGFHAGIHVPQGGLPLSMAGQPDPQSVRLGQALIAELEQEHETPLLLEALMNALILHMLRRTSGQEVETRRSPSGLAPHVLRRVTDYIQDHLDESLSLEMLAQVAGTSVSHFCAMFRESTGRPPHQFLVQQRVAKARRLLVQTSLSIGEIAFQTGFGSPSQFSFAFKKAVRCTPQEYRRSGGIRAVFTLPQRKVLSS